MVTYLDELVQKITTKADLKAFDTLDKKQKRAQKQNDMLARSFKKAFGIFLSIQGARSIVETSRKFDLMQKSIKGLTKSADDFKYLRQEAYRTGTDLLTIAGSYKNFYSAATGAGFSRGAIQSMFSDVLVAGRGIGASQQQIGSALLALEQMLSKGRVSMEELRRQMGNALPGAFEVAARSMGVTTAELNKLIASGIASAEFVPKFTAQLKKELGSGFGESIKSLDFALVNLSTAWQEFQANILQGEGGEALAQLAKELTALLRSDEFLQGVKLISKTLGFIIKNLKWILIYWGTAKILQMSVAIKRLHQSILLTAYSTKLAGTATHTLALGYKYLVGGKVLSGLRLLNAGMWSLVAPTLILSAKIAAIVAGILMIQDVLLAMADPTADTYFKNPNSAEVQKAEEEYAKYHGNQAPLRGQTVGERMKQQQKDIKAIRKIPATLAPLDKNVVTLPTELPSVNPNNYNGNYSERKNNQQNNNIAINVYPQPGQTSEEIGEAIANKLGSVLDEYTMVT